MTATIDGPRLPAAIGTAKSLVVLLHGYGADGNDLIELGAQWQRLLPDTAFVAPHAPGRIPGFPPGMGGGRQWFALRDVVREAEDIFIIAVVPLERDVDADAVALAADRDRLGQQGIFVAVEPFDEGRDAALVEQVVGDVLGVEIGRA